MYFCLNLSLRKKTLYIREANHGNNILRLSLLIIAGSSVSNYSPGGVPDLLSHGEHFFDNLKADDVKNESEKRNT